MSLPYGAEATSTPQASTEVKPEYDLDEVNPEYDLDEVTIQDATAVIELREPTAGEVVAYDSEAGTRLRVWPSNVKPLGVVDIYYVDEYVDEPVDESKRYQWIATEPYGRIEAGDIITFDRKQPTDGEHVIYETGGGLAITRWPADVKPFGTVRSACCVINRDKRHADRMNAGEQQE
jgi:hypothetical protein